MVAQNSKIEPHFGRFHCDMLELDFTLDSLNLAVQETDVLWDRACVEWIIDSKSFIRNKERNIKMSLWHF